MYTQCSNCATVFRIIPEHLRQAQGLARCCWCQDTFDALASLTGTLPAGLPVEATVEFQQGEQSRQIPAAVEAPALGEADLFATLSPLADDAPAAALATPAPRRTGGLGLAAVMVVMLGVLLLAYGYLMREELGRYPQVRPWVDTLCQAVGCELPLLRDVARIHILYKDVGALSASSADLAVRATLVNDTGFHQPYPQIRFRFLDPVGAIQASRWFAPDDYLTEEQKSEVAAGMPPQEPVAIRLQVAGMDIAATDNFAIDLR